MALRPPRRPTPTRRPRTEGVQVPGALARGATSSPEPMKALAEANDGMHDLIAQFTSALDEDPSLDPETKAFLREQFGLALDDAPDGLDLLEQLGNRGVWVEAVQSMQDSGAIAENEANDLVRQLEQAIAPLQSRESKLAIEFSRRMQSDGEDAALEWFRAQVAQGEAEAAQKAATPTAASGDGVLPLRTEITQSRSRRLRAPPRPR